MILPKKIEILNHTFKIVRTDTIYGSFHFSTKSRESSVINIKKDIPEEDVAEIFIHECLEIIYELLRVRYVRPDNQEYEFHYDHQIHDITCKILAKIILSIR